MTAGTVNPQPSRGMQTLLALLLLLPICALWTVVQLIPAYNTLQMSTADVDIRGESEFIGSENFDRLREDGIFGQSLGYTLVILIGRVAVVLIVPPLVGLLAGAGNTLLRTLARILIVGVTLLIVPVSLAIFWRMMTSPTSDIGQQFSMLALNSADGARVSVLYLDMLITAAIGVAVGATAFMAVVRGRSLKPGNWSAAVWVYILGILLAVASVSLTFQLPYILTQGGPARATSTLPLLSFEVGFRMLRLGYAAAVGSVVLLLSTGMAFVVWLVLFISRLRIRYAPPLVKTNTAAGIFGLLLVIVFGLPLLNVILLGQAAISDFPARDSGPDFAADFATALVNTLAVPSMIIWSLQIIVTYLLGLALGYLRPVNRVFSEVIFLGFLILAFFPKDVLAFQWFLSVREMDMLNSQALVGIASIVSPVSLILLKLYFDGAREQVDAARAAGDARAGFSRIFAGSVGIALLAGVIALFSNTIQLYLPLLGGIDRDTWTLPLLITNLSGQYFSEFQAVAGLALSFMGIIAGIFVLPLLLLHVLVLDRLGIIAGQPVAVSAAAAVDEFAEFR